MWWEGRIFGLRATRIRTGETIAWVVPIYPGETGWSARFTRFAAQEFDDPHDAWNWAQAKVGEAVDWWIFRLGNNKPLRRIKRGSTR